jgi:hypothetical protein
VADRQSCDDEEVRGRYVDFLDRNASKFLIADVYIRPHIEDVEHEKTTVSTGRITKQGVRDLNHYGPRPAKEVAEAPPAAAVADKQAGREAGPPAASSAPDGGEPRAP